MTILLKLVNISYKSVLTNLGKFLELSTVWTATKEEIAPSHDKSLAQRVWRTRQIGIFFTKVGASWVFLALLAPLSATYDYKEWKEEEFRFCVRDNFGDQPYEWFADDMPVQDLIKKHIARNLEKHPDFLTRILIDVFWGWERYIAQIRNDIRGVRASPNNLLNLDYDQI